MNYTAMPTSVRSLEQRIRNMEGSDGLVLRRRVGMALVVVGQMLPDGAIKGGQRDGVALRARYPVHSRSRCRESPADREIPQRLRGRSFCRVVGVYRKAGRETATSSSSGA